MKVIEANDIDSGFVERVTFDNGLVLDSDFTSDCCERNLLDFEQLHVGREFPDMTGDEFLEAIVKAEDGFSIMDSFNVPAWVQARSYQNGYYGSGVDLVVTYNGVQRSAPRERHADDHMFNGEISDG